MTTLTGLSGKQYRKLDAPITQSRSATFVPPDLLILTSGLTHQGSSVVHVEVASLLTYGGCDRTSAPSHRAPGRVRGQRVTRPADLERVAAPTPSHGRAVPNGVRLHHMAQRSIIRSRKARHGASKQTQGGTWTIGGLNTRYSELDRNTHWS